MSDPQTRRNMSVDRLWGVDEAARFLHVSRSFVYKLVESGELPCARIGACIRFMPEHIRHYVERVTSPMRP